MRAPAWLILFMACIVSWYGMQAVHELGHVIVAWGTGHTVEHVHLPLIGFSETELGVYSRPAGVVWAGPVLGCFLPILLGLPFRKAKTRRLWWFTRFFAGFCCLANGAYLGLGWIDRVGDTGELLQQDVHPVWLSLVGFVMAGLGLILWHRLGPRLGLQPPNPSP